MDWCDDYTLARETPELVIDIRTPDESVVALHFGKVEKSKKCTTKVRLFIPRILRRDSRLLYIQPCSQTYTTS